MKQVLLIDASPIFMEFLKERLLAEQIKVETAAGNRDAFQKMVSLMPDLVIVDVESDILHIQDFLDNKISEPNAAKLPMMIVGPEIPRSSISNLAKYGVFNYFTKPIKFDVFFEAIGRIIKTRLTIDETPSVIETHVNGNIIFVDIAQGLNRDKIEILKYKLDEIVEKNKMHDPKIIIMMTSLDLTFVDGTNLEILFDNLIGSFLLKNIKVLSLNKFTTDLIEGHPAYHGIEVVESLNDILNSLVDSGTTADDVIDIVSDKILFADDEIVPSSIDTRFGNDNGGSAKNDEQKSSTIKVAIVDNDEQSRNILVASFKAINAEAVVFENGTTFQSSIANDQFDVVIMDLNLSDINGLDILRNLQRQGFTTPIIVYSQPTSKEGVIQALSLGARSFLVKPQKPALIIQKALGVLNS
ncbi:MAG: response regulator [Treponema sp.]|nr:response regulator [Treponema sp.]MBR7078914.1 response regulator [Treponema sp.]